MVYNDSLHNKMVSTTVLQPFLVIRSYFYQCWIQSVINGLDLHRFALIFPLQFTTYCSVEYIDTFQETHHAALCEGL